MNQITFGQKKSYDDYGLLLETYEINPPEVRTSYVDVPGADGSLDLSEAIADRPIYSNRSLTFEFTILSPRSEWEAKASMLRSDLHGKKMRVFEPDDTNHYYVTRLSVGLLKRDGEIATVSVTGTAEPYKYKNNPTTVAVLSTETSQQVILPNADMPVVPTITTSASITILFESNNFALSAGTYQVAIILEKGENTLTVTGDSQVSFMYQEGVL